MRAAAGYSALAIGAAAAFYGISSIGFGLHTGRPGLVRFGRRCAYVTLAAAVAAFAVMEWALFARDFSIEYVAENVARATPGLYTFTAAWAALEGSILLWILALTGYVAFTTWRFRDRAGDPLVAWATIVALGVTLFFFVLTLGPANPFREVAGAVPGDGRGPNALLQNHPLVAFHPPALYLGYVGFTVPFSFAVAALVTGRFGEGWLADVRRTTVVAWGFLTVGIVLGMWWSYEVLGWGGYWGWDPVENASLLPWLTGTAFIHSVMVQERRGMLRVWNLSLVLATFCLTILGTFLTRSGVVTSVHAFSQSDIGPWLLAFLGVAAFGSVALVAWRADRLRTPARIDSPVSREAAFLLNNLLFGGFALVVLTGTVFPLLAEALDDRQLSVGEPYFERMGTPIGIALLFLMAVGPQLPWRAASGEVLRRRLLVPAWAGGLTNEELAREKKDLQANLTPLTRFYNERIRWTKYLHLLPSLMPEESWIESIEGSDPAWSEGAGRRVTERFLLLRAATVYPRGAQPPAAIEATLNALRDAPAIQEAFPVVRVADISWQKTVGVDIATYKLLAVAAKPGSKPGQ